MFQFESGPNRVADQSVDLKKLTCSLSGRFSAQSSRVKGVCREAEDALMGAILLLPSDATFWLSPSSSAWGVDCDALGELLNMLLNDIDDVTEA